MGNPAQLQSLQAGRKGCPLGEAPVAMGYESGALIGAARGRAKKSQETGPRNSSQSLRGVSHSQSIRNRCASISRSSRPPVASQSLSWRSQHICRAVVKAPGQPRESRASSQVVTKRRPFFIPRQRAVFHRMPGSAVIDQVKSALQPLEVDAVEIWIGSEIDKRTCVCHICCIYRPTIVNCDQVPLVALNVQLLVFVRHQYCQRPPSAINRLAWRCAPHGR